MFPIKWSRIDFPYSHYGLEFLNSFRSFQKRPRYILYDTKLFESGHIHEPNRGPFLQNEQREAVFDQ